MIQYGILIIAHVNLSHYAIVKFFIRFHRYAVIKLSAGLCHNKIKRIIKLSTWLKKSPSAISDNKRKCTRIHLCRPVYDL